jgi:aryl-alcohol dehydrogenase-like predicted oxidoreductase
MDKVKLPHSDLEITRLAFGAWPIAGGFNWGPQDEKDSRATLRAAYEAGINFFDTAEGYGNGKSEELIARELGTVRSDIILASKISPGDFNYHNVKEACDKRLAILKTDYLDLLQLHWPNWEIPHQETVKALEELKAEGKIRAYGISNYGLKDISDFYQAGGSPSSNQLPYNLIWRAIEFEILPVCNQKSLPVLAYMPLMQGMLTGKFKSVDEIPEDRARTRHFSSTRPLTRHQEAGFEEETFETLGKIKELASDHDVSMANLCMAWLMKRKGVASILVGARNPEQVNRNIQVLNVALSDQVMQELDKISENLKHKLGPNADMWQDNSRIR